MSALRDAALAYAERGYRVFPCVPGDKRPATEHGCKDATADPEQINAWWTEMPSANVALATDGLVVVDLDVIDGKSNPWADSVPESTEPGAVSSTPRGGLHWLFRQNGSPISNSTSKLAPKVDVRANGGYIVAPPSMVNGKAYSWESEPPAAGDLPVVPHWLEQELTRPTVSTTEAPAVSMATMPSGGADAVERARAYIAAIPGAVAGQGGHAQTFRAALHIRKGFSLSNDEALAVLREWNATCSPPWSEKELIHKVQSAAKSDIPEGFHLTDRPVAEWITRYIAKGGDSGQSQNTLGTNGHGKSTDIPFNAEWCGKLSLDIKPMCDVEREDVSPLWPYRFYLGKLSIVAGHPGFGKSFFTHWLASRVSVGGRVPFQDANFPLGDVLLLASEDGPGDTIRPRLEACGADLTRIHVVEGVSEQTPEGKRIARMVRLDRDIAGLRQTLAQRRDEGRPVVLIVVDVLDSYLGKTDAWKSTEVRAVLGPFAAMAAEFNACVIGVSHLNKAGSGPAVTRAAGSMAFVGLARSAWLVCMDPEDVLAPTGTSNRRLLIQTKNNLSPAQRSLGFAITDAGLIFTDESDVTADAALARPDKRDDKKDRGGTLEACCDWLRTRLADGFEHPSDAVKDEAREAGHTFATFRRAKEEL